MRRNNKKAAVLAIAFISITTLSAFISPVIKPAMTVATAQQKKAAFQVLNTKCNVCHRKQNKKKIFSLQNMSGFAPLINQQVFVLRRMPRGKKIKLTANDYQTLKSWLLTQNLNK